MHYINNICKEISKMQATQDQRTKDYEPAIHRRWNQTASKCVVVDEIIGDNSSLPCRSSVPSCLCHRLIGVSPFLLCGCRTQRSALGQKQKCHKQALEMSLGIGVWTLCSWLCSKKRIARCPTGPRNERDTRNRHRSRDLHPEAEPHPLGCKPIKTNDCL